jgi:hypothetical protein
MKQLNDYIKFLGLTKPVTLCFKTRTHKKCDGFYIPYYSNKSGNLLEHRITIYLTNASRDINTLIAHELIHAWQEENKKSEIHGIHFKRLAKIMAQEFNLENIYMEGIDLK